MKLSRALECLSRLLPIVGLLFSPSPKVCADTCLGAGGNSMPIETVVGLTYPVSPYSDFTDEQGPYLDKVAFKDGAQLCLDGECAYWKFHLGQDINKRLNNQGGECFDCDRGTLISSIANGKVIAIQPNNYGSWGRYVFLEHQWPSGSTFYSLYAHLDSVSVATDQCVAEGAMIGAMGDSGTAASGVHLHFELRPIEGDVPGNGYAYHYDLDRLDASTSPELFISLADEPGLWSPPPATTPNPAHGAMIGDLPECPDDRGLYGSTPEKRPCLQWTEAPRAVFYEVFIDGLYDGRIYGKYNEDLQSTRLIYFLDDHLEYGAHTWEVIPFSPWAASQQSQIWSVFITKQCFAPSALDKKSSSATASSCMDAGQPPTAETLTPGQVTSTSATLRMTADPRGSLTNAWLLYGAETAGYPYETLHTNVGSGNGPVLHSSTVTGLKCENTYHVRAIAESSKGIKGGDVVVFQTGDCGTSAFSPTVATQPATDTSSSSARIHMVVNPNGTNSDAGFVWGEAEASLSFSVPQPPYNVGSGTSSVSRSFLLTALDCGQTYYYQAWADGYGPAVSGEVLSFRTDSCGGGGGSNPDDLILNGDFADDDDHWVATGYFQADSRFNSYRSYPGYAYLANLDGSWGNLISGELYQDVTIPSDADSATLKYWYWISTDEPGGSPPRDVVTATIRDDNGVYLMGLDSYSNNDAYSGGYRSDEFDLSDFIGNMIRVHFIGTTSNSYPTVFRLDDVSLFVTYDSGGGSSGFDLEAFNPSVDDSTLTPGHDVRFTFSTTNVGDERAPDDVPVTYYLDGTAVGYDSEETALDPGEVDSEAETFSVPDIPGTYYAWACLATYSEEPDTSNNCTDEIALTVAEDPTEGPDIVIIDTTTSSTTLLAGETFNMTAIVKNVGNKSLSANSLVRFLVTLDGSLDLNDQMLEADTVSWLSVGQERIASETMQAPLEPGTYLLGACVKVLGEEIDESNNCSPDPFTLQVLPNGCQPEVVSLAGLAILGEEVYEACQTIEAGPSTSVEAGGFLELHAPRVVFYDGFRVNNGGQLIVYTNQSSPLLEDDFNDGSIDSARWTWGGNTASEQQGELHLNNTVTDDEGWAETVSLPIDRTKKLVVTKRVKLHYANQYFAALMVFNWTDFPEYKFRVNYSHFYYTGGSDCVADGISITRNNTNAHRCPDRDVDGSAFIAALWDEWFDERVVYDPVTGDVEYFVNGELKISYNVGPLPVGADTLQIWLSGSGWYTGHYQYIDDFHAYEE